MDLKKLVPLKETCLKLKALGWKIETFLVWVKHNAFDENSWKPEEANRYGYEGLEDRFYAPTVSELGEVLPFEIDDYRIEQIKIKNKWLVYYRVYYEEAELDLCPHFEHENEAECRALTLIHLIENKHIEL